MNLFPLYETLKADLPKKDLTLKERKKFLENILEADQEAHELLFVLIKCFYLENEKFKTYEIPYEAEVLKDKINFDLASFPPSLKQLLYKFLCLHMKRKEEEKMCSRPEDL